MFEKTKEKLIRFEELYGYKVSEELFPWFYLSILSSGSREFNIIHKSRNFEANAMIFPRIKFELNEKTVLEKMMFLLHFLPLHIY